MDGWMNRRKNGRKESKKKKVERKGRWRKG